MPLLAMKVTRAVLPARPLRNFRQNCAKIRKLPDEDTVAREMGWMPLSPNGIAMCQAWDVYAQATGEGIRGTGYNHRR